MFLILCEQDPLKLDQFFFLNIPQFQFVWENILWSIPIENE